MTNSNPETDSKATNSENEVFEKPMGRGRGKGRFWRIPFVVAIFILAKSAVFMVLWNHLIPELFHGPIVNFGQALGLLILAKLLVGFGGGHRFGPGRHLRGRWAALSNEERQKLRSELRSRWGHRGA